MTFGLLPERHRARDDDREHDQERQASESADPSRRRWHQQSGGGELQQWERDGSRDGKTRRQAKTGK
jgi:hypothetical protein